MAFDNCQISSDIALDCRDSNGGIEKIFIANANGAVTYTLASGSDCEIASISVDGTPLTSADFYTWTTPKQTSSFTETANIAPEAGTVFYTQELQLIFNKMQCSTRDQLLLLAQNTQLLVVVKDNNGAYWSVGLLRGAEMTAGTATTGTAYADANQYTVTITGYEINPTFLVDSTIVEA